MADNDQIDGIDPIEAEILGLTSPTPPSPAPARQAPVSQPAPVKPAAISSARSKNKKISNRRLPAASQVQEEEEQGRSWAWDVLGSLVILALALLVLGITR